MKQIVLAVVIMCGVASSASKQDRANKWMVAFDDVVDEARDLHISGLEDSLTALRICALGNMSDKCADILRPLTKGELAELANTRLSGKKPQ